MSTAFGLNVFVPLVSSLDVLVYVPLEVDGGRVSWSPLRASCRQSGVWCLSCGQGELLRCCDAAVGTERLPKLVKKWSMRPCVLAA